LRRSGCRRCRTSAAAVDRQRLGMDRQRLCGISRVSRARRCGRRVQRQVHVQSDGPARRRRGHALRSYADHLSKLLSACRPLGVLGTAPGGRSRMNDVASFDFHDLAPDEESFRETVLSGLASTPKVLPCKLFYDARGSALFEAICETPEYYLTRTEIAILEEYADNIAVQIGPHARLIELGSGASRKVRILLQALQMPAAYVPVDISREHLREA